MVREKRHYICNNGTKMMVFGDSFLFKDREYITLPYYHIFYNYPMNACNYNNTIIDNIMHASKNN